MKTMTRVFVAVAFALIISWSFTPVVQAGEWRDVTITHAGMNYSSFYINVEGVGWLQIISSQPKAMLAIAMSAISLGKKALVYIEGDSTYVIYLTNTNI